MQRVTLYLDDDLWRQFRLTCMQQSLSASKVFSLFVERYLAMFPLDLPREKTARQALAATVVDENILQMSLAELRACVTDLEARFAARAQEDKP